ncbi:DUF2752 domain-containing protein [Cellulomonas sp. P22]|uniref:DUF2752 domain-containing protein n=1 Tax=Cellulomonas sp. P22 TaxID=3373189 RepID=UPI0037A3F45A
MTEHGPPPTTEAGRAASGTLAARWGRLRGPVAVAALTGAATLYVALVDPHTPGHYAICPLLRLTGLYCAGCGGLRATHDLAHGDLAGAWAMNPLWVLTVPLLGVLWTRWVVGSWRGSTPAPDRRPRTWTAWLLLVVVLGYSALRNVPVLAPWLAP